MSMSHWRGARRSSNWLLCAMLVLGPMAVTACGSIAAPVFSATPAGTGPAAPDASGPDATGSAAAANAVPADLALCANPASASRVMISRSSALRQVEPAQVLPPTQVVVTTAVNVRALAEALCALPRMGAGVFHCPLLLEGTYMLRFTANGRRLPVVTAQEFGCEIVRGLGPARSAGKSREFWTVLATTLATASPVQPVFPDNPPRQDCQMFPAGALGNTFCPGRATPGRSSHK